MLLCTFIILCLVQCACIHGETLGEPLFLTDFIEEGQIENARKLAEVRDLKPHIKSYSGLISVDKVNGVHNFFWFFPAADNADTAPLILYSEGGPGLTALVSIINANGPYSATQNGTLLAREFTWTKNYSVIYVDQPNNVGYSYCEDEESYVSSAPAAAPYMYEFLMQFFLLFPEFKGNYFYNAGFSYGGKYATTFANYIHRKNLEASGIHINLRGVFIDSPWFDPINQINYGEYLFHAGLIDSAALDHFKNMEYQMKKLILEQRYGEAQQINEDLLWGPSRGTKYWNATSLSTVYNILSTHSALDFDIAKPRTVGELPSFRKSVHVGDLPFSAYDHEVRESFQVSILESSVPFCEELLNYGYKIVIVAPQLDIITNHVGIGRAVENMCWKGASVFRGAPRQAWWVGDNVMGYVKSGGGLTYAMVRNSGHGVSINKPELALKLLDDLTREVRKSKAPQGNRDFEESLVCAADCRDPAIFKLLLGFTLLQIYSLVRNLQY